MVIAFINALALFLVVLPFLYTIKDSEGHLGVQIIMDLVRFTVSPMMVEKKSPWQKGRQGAQRILLSQLRSHDYIVLLSSIYLHNHNYVYHTLEVYIM